MSESPDQPPGHQPPERRPPERGCGLIVSLGSNIDAGRYLPAALAAIERHPDFAVRGRSPVYASAPVGRTDQPVFFNAALWLQSSLADPEAIRREFRIIEADLDRVRDPADPSGPRTIDLDLVLIEAMCCTRPELPDADLFTRWFVAVPAGDAAPGLMIPGDGRTLAELAAELRPQSDGEAYGWLPGETVPPHCGQPADPPRYVPAVPPRQ